MEYALQIQTGRQAATVLGMAMASIAVYVMVLHNVKFI